MAASQANLEKAQATRCQTQADYERTAGLAKEGVMSQQQLDLAKANCDSADAGGVRSQGDHHPGHRSGPAESKPL